MQITLGQTPVSLLSQKALFFPRERILVMADLHLGKAMHFRKAGIYMPQLSAARDYEVLQQLMEVYRPAAVWFLGDLFHSQANSELRLFEAFLHSHPGVAFTLIRGNHDIVHPGYYEERQVRVVAEALEWETFIFSHEPLATDYTGRINIAGHIHPGISVQRQGRQRYRLPCFYFYRQTLLLPAFGALTGLHTLDRSRADAVYAIVGDEVVPV